MSRSRLARTRLCAVLSSMLVLGLAASAPAAPPPFVPVDLQHLPVPAGVHDVGLEIWSQPDAFAPWDPPTAQDPATDGAYGETTQGALMESAAAGSLLTDGGRLLVAANPASPPALTAFTEPLARRGSMVWVVGPGLTGEAGADRVDGLAQAERVTAVMGQPTRS